MRFDFLSILFILYITQYANASGKVTIGHCECGLANDAMKRIVGGKETAPHQYPWTVAVLRQGNMHCGGALINDRYVLSAGHCIKWTSIDTLTARLGMHDIKKKSEGLTLKIKEGILHEKFASDYLHDTHDIALLKLEKHVTFSTTISPICLPNPDSQYVGAKAVVAGWGRLGQNQQGAEKLLAAHVFVMRQEGCLQTHLKDHITDTMMCAYNTKTDSCQGDSGGPLIYEKEEGKMELIGVVSWGIGCATPGLPGVYTKVTSYLDWISAHAHDATYCAA